MAEIGYDLNLTTENIGARRLQTVMSVLLEDLLFDAPDLKIKKFKVDKKQVQQKFGKFIEDKDLSKFIL